MVRSSHLSQFVKSLIVLVGEEKGFKLFMMPHWTRLLLLMMFPLCLEGDGAAGGASPPVGCSPPAIQFDLDCSHRATITTVAHPGG